MEPKVLILMFLLGACVFALGVLTGVYLIYFGPRSPDKPVEAVKTKEVGFKL